MKNIIKITLTIILTIAAYKYAEIERGKFLGIIGGGEMLVPFMCWLLFWIFPGIVKELKGGKKKCLMKKL
nr:MAG TPA: hypothetical protein [Caudoviricetes sp.]